MLVKVIVSDGSGAVRAQVLEVPALAPLASGDYLAGLLADRLDAIAVGLSIQTQSLMLLAASRQLRRLEPSAPVSLRRASVVQRSMPRRLWSAHDPA